MKRTLFFMLLSALLWGGAATVQAKIISGECSAEGANVTWTLDTETGKLEISGTGEMKDFKSFDETPWFDYSSVITSVSVGNGVTAVGNYAFYNCTELTNLRIEDSADTLNIKRYLFTNCPLDTVYLGRNIVAWIRQGLAKLRTYPFSLKTSLVSLTIGTQVTAIGDGVFSSCSGLTSVTIPHSVTAIGNDAFAGCTGLTNLRIEDSAETLEFTDCSEEHMPFADCPLDTVYLGRNISYDSNYSPFKDKINLVSLTIGNQVTAIGEYTFSGCWSLHEVAIGDGVTTIGNEAFAGCFNLMSVTIPHSVTAIGNDVFSDCWGLKSVTLYATNPPEIQNSFVKSGVYVYVPAESIAQYKAAERWKNLNIKYKVDGIGYDILSSDERTAKVINGGYSGDIVIPETMEYEGITYRVTAIGNDAFYDCSGLTSVTIGDGVTTIGDGVFSGCSGLPSVTIPESVTAIGNDAFYDCSGLTSVTIPKSVTSIGNYAFKECASLKEIAIPEGITAISNEVFSGCSGLTSITIPENVTSIGNNAFSGCSNLTSVTIPESVTTIDYSAFSGDTSLTSVTIPESVTTIGDWAFYNCSGLTSVTIGDGVTTIGDGVFIGCSGLPSIMIPNSVTSIGYEVFSGCSGLTSITIPESVQTIGDWAFYNCSGLTSVTAYNPTPVNIVITYEWDYPHFAFESVDCANCKLYVPKGSVEAYRNAEGWKEFGTILPIGASAITETQQDAEHITVYNLQGVLVLETDDAADLKTLQHGAYIVNGKKMIIAR